MIKKTITYTDYNDVTHQEDFYFNLSELELTRMEMHESTLRDGEVSGGLQNMLNAIIKSGSGRRIMETFEDILARSYGVRSEDGKRFIKNQEVLDAFLQSPAYEVFFMELVTDADVASEFINGLIPAKFTQEGQAQAQDAPRKPQDFQKPKQSSGLKSVPNLPNESEQTQEPTNQVELTPEELEIIRKNREEN